MYDSREDLVIRLSSIRAALTKAREAASYQSGANLSVTRDYTTLLREEKDVLTQIDAIDARNNGNAGGMSNKVSFQRPE